MSRRCVQRHPAQPATVARRTELEHTEQPPCLVRPDSAKLDQASSNFGRNSAKNRQCLVEIWPNSARFGQFRPDSAKVRQSSTSFGKISRNMARVRPDSAGALGPPPHEACGANATSFEITKLVECARQNWGRDMPTSCRHGNQVDGEPMRRDLLKNGRNGSKSKQIGL